jgi:glycosyltransferase involved in cell wall biosynthesis
MKKICLITPGHISSNPRLVKEMQTLANENYTVYVIFTQYLDLLTNEDFKIIKANPLVTFKFLDWTGNSIKSKITRVLSGSVQRATLFLHRITNNGHLLKHTINRNFVWQLQSAISIRADLYIAHNLAALPIAVEAAKANNAKSGFDAEDFHRQQTTDDKHSKHYIDAKSLEDFYIPNLNYFTSASPLINEEYYKLYPDVNGTVINNVFSKDYIQDISVQNNQDRQDLKLFWFSQTIGKNRGIEQAIEAIGHLKNENVSLTLLGLINDVNRDYFTSLILKHGLLSSQLQFAAFKSFDQLFSFANKFDIGLALEPGFCLNNKIALSNKLFTYLTSNLAIIATETNAQKEFMEAYPGIGKSFQINDTKQMGKHIEYYIKYPKKLIEAKKETKRLALNELNWEIESRKFLHVIKNTL